MDAAFRRRLKTLMYENGINSYRKLAAAAGVHENTVYRLVNSDGAKMTLGTAAAISKALGCSAEYLLWGVR